MGHKVGDMDDIIGVKYGAVTSSKSRNLLIVRTEKGTFMVRVRRSDGRTAGVKDLRYAMAGAINQMLDLSKL